MVFSNGASASIEIEELELVLKNYFDRKVENFKFLTSLLFIGQHVEILKRFVRLI